MWYGIWYTRTFCKLCWCKHPVRLIEQKCCVKRKKIHCVRLKLNFFFLFFQDKISCKSVIFPWEYWIHSRYYWEMILNNFQTRSSYSLLITAMECKIITKDSLLKIINISPYSNLWSMSRSALLMFYIIHA